MLPPMSVPTPKKLPRKLTSADSPPEEPPDVSLRFRGLHVVPNTLLTVSPRIKVAGTFVLAYRIAPAFRSRVTRVDSSDTGLLALDM
jgi:hypothetical protein